MELGRKGMPECHFNQGFRHKYMYFLQIKQNKQFISSLFTTKTSKRSNMFREMRLLFMCKQS